MDRAAALSLHWTGVQRQVARGSGRMEALRRRRVERPLVQILIEVAISLHASHRSEEGFRSH